MKERQMKRIHLAAAVLAATVAAAPAFAADVHIGINIVPPAIAFDAPPRLVIVPGVPHVQYAPDVSVNYFTYGSDYYTYDGGHWFVAHEERGPWTYVERRYVPAPVLHVPTRYYRVPPRLVGGGHWNGQRHYSSYQGHHKGDWHGGHGGGHDDRHGHGNGHNGNGHGNNGNGHGNGKDHDQHH
jgi:hypothetical protein